MRLDKQARWTMDRKSYSGYKTERKASKSLHSMSARDMMVGRASWSRMSSRANRVEKYAESREKKYRWTQYSVLPTYYIVHRVLSINMMFTQSLNVTHQKCDVSIFEEVFVVSYGRALGCISPRVHANRWACPTPTRTRLNHLGTRMLGLRLSRMGSTLNGWTYFEIVGEQGIEGDHGWCFRKTRRGDFPVFTPRDYYGSGHEMER